jgi:hypothetical protein
MWRSYRSTRDPAADDGTVLVESRRQGRERVRLRLTVHRDVAGPTAAALVMTSSIASLSVAMLTRWASGVWSKNGVR